MDNTQQYHRNTICHLLLKIPHSDVASSLSHRLLCLLLMLVLSHFHLVFLRLSWVISWEKSLLKENILIGTFGHSHKPGYTAELPLER